MLFLSCYCFFDVLESEFTCSLYLSLCCEVNTSVQSGYFILVAYIDVIIDIFEKCLQMCVNCCMQAYYEVPDMQKVIIL
jgi:hypothetical protein